MPANKFNGFTDYGIGIGLRVPHYDHILGRKPSVGWFEIISENFMCDGGRPLAVLDQILEQYRVVQHGVSMYFGSSEELNREHLKKLKRLVKRTKTPWLSDHLCWGSVDGRYTHDLLPMPYTFAAARVTARRIREARDFLEVPIAVENVSSYAEFHVSEMTEWEFLNEVVDQADCGILLDVNNIYVSSRNHGFNPFDYVNGIPAERVAQIHIAGHSKFEKYILDTHDHPVIDPVWKLYERATQRAGKTATLLEWDDRIPSFDEVHTEALKAGKFLSRLKKPTPSPSRQTEAEFHELQRLMAAAVMRPLGRNDGMQKKWVDGRPTRRVAESFIKPNDRLTSFERLEIYNRQYWLRVRASFYEDYPGLRAVLGDKKFERLADAYLDRYPSQSYSLRNLGSRLVKYLESQSPRVLPHKLLALDLARLEWAHTEAFDNEARTPLKLAALSGMDAAKINFQLQPHLTLLRLRHEVDDFLIDLKSRGGLRHEASNAMEQDRKHLKSRLARVLKSRVNYLAVHRHRNAVYYKRLEPAQYRLLTALQKGATLEAACGKLAGLKLPGNLGETIQQWFQTWAKLGWFCNLKQL